MPQAVISAEPKFTSVAPVKLVPVRITLLPPSVEPVDGLRFVNVGGAMYVYVNVAVVPPGFTTSTLTPAAALAGTPFTVICVLLLIAKQGADGHGVRSFDPKFTSVAVLKLVPVSTTLFPPAV